ncbi:cell wall hydrolase [Croceicoccus bisphenolivorans]|uniref:cell wall hydrolase n=1 Tax=Croceicoccus bisphenolivorans TaxID=1783232 RepID=UPI00082F4C4C|nr:cell wall hydrolase [Croceicoccus bisphenolivorans]
MSRKVKSASALSLVATLGVTLLGTDGSSAMAEASVAMPALVSPAETAISAPEAIPGAQAESADAVSGTQFISQPVVQPVPAVETIVAGAPRDAASLAELVAEEPVPGKLDEQMRCLAGAIYFESKGEPLAGQLAVGRVIIARAESGRFPSSYCGVVYQRSQFSFVRGGRMPSIDTSSRAWQRAKKIATIAHEGAWESVAEGALFFHARYVSPRWKNRMTRLAQIDNHIFYR